MEMFKVMKATQKKSTESVKNDINQQNNEIIEDEDDFTIKNNEKIKIGNRRKNCWFRRSFK